MQAQDAHKDNNPAAPRFGTPPGRREEGRYMVTAAQRKGLVHTLGMPQPGEGEEEEREQAGRPEGSLEAPLEWELVHILQDQAHALGHLQCEDDPCFLLRNTDRVRIETGLCGRCHEFGCSSLLFLLLLFVNIGAEMLRR
jgi:hypothetical protein